MGDQRHAAGVAVLADAQHPPAGAVDRVVSHGDGEYAAPMASTLKLVLLALLALMLVVLVGALFSSDTGGAEKAVLVLLAGGVIWAAARVRRIAARPA